jgi:hypothetical protein
VVLSGHCAGTTGKNPPLPAADQENWKSQYVVHTLSGMIAARYATPASAMPLLVPSPAVELVCVPWPSESKTNGVGAVSEIVKSAACVKRVRSKSGLGASGTEICTIATPFHVRAERVRADTAVTPESIVAMTTAGSPPGAMSHADGILSCWRFHCRENDGSLGIACIRPR